MRWATSARSALRSWSPPRAWPLSRVYLVRAGAPTVEQFAEVCAIDLAVMIDVARTSRRPSGARPPSTEQNAEVCAIDCAIASQTRWALRACRFECDGVGVAPRDAGARSEIRGRVALAVVVVSPAPDDAISACALLARNNARREKRSNKPRPHEEWTRPPGVFSCPHCSKGTTVLAGFQQQSRARRAIDPQKAQKPKAQTFGFKLESG